MIGDEWAAATPAGHIRLVEAREQALAQLAALRRNFDGIVDAALLVNTDDEHDPEGATIAFERAQVTALSRQAEADLAAIDEAMRRFDSGGYGRCEVCGGPVGAERLEALPFAARCVVCAAGT